MKTIEEKREYCRLWYKQNRIPHLEKVKQRQKETNYSAEKTESQRTLRNIKRHTRYYFSLEGKKCDFCDNKATHRHHNTLPIQINKFNYVCPKCHQIKDYELKLKSNVRR